jgi:hypothetical protein
MIINCWNTITITSSKKELKNIIKNEFQYKNESDEYVYKENITIIKEGSRGLKLKMLTIWRPDFDLLEKIVKKFPFCWIKNEWINEEGDAGIWIGFLQENGNKNIDQFEWSDLSIETEYYHFLTEEEENTTI